MILKINYFSKLLVMFFHFILFKVIGNNNQGLSLIHNLWSPLSHQEPCLRSFLIYMVKSKDGFNMRLPRYSCIFKYYKCIHASKYKELILDFSVAGKDDGDAKSIHAYHFSSWMFINLLQGHRKKKIGADWKILISIKVTPFLGCMVYYQKKSCLITHRDEKNCSHVKLIQEQHFYPSSNFISQRGYSQSLTFFTPRPRSSAISNNGLKIDSN